jgi:hypothetical protein
VDQTRFDALARVLSHRVHRRAVVLVALADVMSGEAKGKRRRVVALGGKCRSQDRCRAGLCLRNRCMCGAGQRRCGDRCIPYDGCCVNGDCVVPPSGATCSTVHCRANHTCGLAPVAAGKACGLGDASICDGHGHCLAIACRSSANCPAPGHPCLGIACLDGLCTAQPRPFGEPFGAQGLGDCQARVCDGAGGVIAMPDDEDVPGNPSPCLAVTCESGSVVSTPKPIGTPCGAGQTCNGRGACV